MKLIHLAALAVALAAGPALAQAPVVLKFAADTPSAGGTWKEMLLPWAMKVEAASGGTIKMELYPDGLIAKMGDALVRADSGIADIVWDLPSLYGQRFADTAVSQLPGVYDDPVAATRAFWRAYQKGAIAVAFQDFKVLFIQVVPQSIYYLKAPPKSRTDLSGLKIALGAKQRAQVTEGMGGTALALRSAEYYQAVQKGVADGTMASTGLVQAYKIDDLTHYYLAGPFGGGITILAMNKKKYESLPPAAKKAIDDNSGEAAGVVAATWLRDFEEGYMVNTMLKVPGNKREVLTAEDIAKLRPVFDSVAKSWIDETPKGQATIDAFRAELASITKP